MFLFISVGHLMHFLGCAHTSLETVTLIHRIILWVCVWSLSCVWLFVTAWTIACQASLSMGFSRQQYWNGLLFPTPGDLPNPRIKTTSPVSPYWASLVAQSVKNLPAMQETQVWSLGWEDPLEKGMTTHSSILAWRSPMDRGAWQAAVHGVARGGHDLAAKPPSPVPWADWLFRLLAGPTP